MGLAFLKDSDVLTHISSREKSQKKMEAERKVREHGKKSAVWKGNILSYTLVRDSFSEQV